VLIVLLALCGGEVLPSGGFRRAISSHALTTHALTIDHYLLFIYLKHNSVDSLGKRKRFDEI
jgi:hypothetical protein